MATWEARSCRDQMDIYRRRAAASAWKGKAKDKTTPAVADAVSLKLQLDTLLKERKKHQEQTADKMAACVMAKRTSGRSTYSEYFSFKYSDADPETRYQGTPIEVFPTLVPIPAETRQLISRWTNSRFSYGPIEGGHVQEASNIWRAQGYVRMHRDTMYDDGSEVWGLVLQNDCGAKLAHSSGLQIPMPAGSIYRLNPSEVHGTIVDHYSSEPKGSFVFIAKFYNRREGMTFGRFQDIALTTLNETLSYNGFPIEGYRLHTASSPPAYDYVKAAEELKKYVSSLEVLYDFKRPSDRASDAEMIEQAKKLYDKVSEGTEEQDRLKKWYDELVWVMSEQIKGGYMEVTQLKSRYPRSSEKVEITYTTLDHSFQFKETTDDKAD